VALVDALGNLVRFLLLPGQRHDSGGVESLLHGIALDALIGDKAFDSDWLRAALNARGTLAVIPPNASRAKQIPYDEEMYKWRHLVENFFQKIKEFRRIATRCDKTDSSFRAAIHLVATFLALK
jgi:transposase